MADVKISQLSSADTPLAGTEEVPVVQGGVTKKTTVDDIAAAAGAVTDVTATSPLSSTGGATPDISIPAANGSTSGYLTSTDWNTFNNKQPAGDYVTGPASATDNAITRFDSTTGKLVQNSGVTLNDNNEIGNVNDIAFDTTPGTVPTAPGSLYWDAADNNQTLSLVMAGGNAVQQIGEEIYYRVKASAAITNGQSVMVTGAVGASGGLLAAPASGLTANNGEHLIGVATEDIALNGWGYITQFGLVRNIDTTGASVGETWVDGDTLYYNPSYAGGLTKSVPTAPTALVEVAEVVHAHASSGSLFIRVTLFPRLNQLANVYAPSPADNELIKWSSSASRWETTPIKTVNSVSLIGSGNVSTGDIVGPASATDNAVARFDGTTGKLIQNSAVTIDDSGNVTLSAGTANGVAYLDGSKVLTTGSALTFNGTSFGVGSSDYGNAGTISLSVGVAGTTAGGLQLWSTTSAPHSVQWGDGTTGSDPYRGAIEYSHSDDSMRFYVAAAEKMRLTSSLLSVVPGATIEGITVGRGAGAVSTNTAVGASALAANTTGAYTTAVGWNALNANTTGGGAPNSAFGYNSLALNTTGGYNFGAGGNSLYSNTTGNYNTGLGMQALYSNTTASNNTAVGYQAGYSNTTGAANTALGDRALYTNSTGSELTAVGGQALYLNTTGQQNSAFGRFALYSNTTGSYNTAIGISALNANTTASNNTAVGYQAGYSGTTAQQSTLVGYQAGYAATGSYNEAFGYQAFYSNGSGTENIALGRQAMYSNTSGAFNTAVGQNALRSNTTANNNTALGFQSLLSNTTASNNTAVGYQAGYSNTTGTDLVAVGSGAAYSNTTGAGNMAMGQNALYANTTGVGNTALGTQHTGVGNASLNANTTGSYNTAVGTSALRSNTTASNNTAVGYQAGFSNTTGAGNTFLGYQAGYGVTTSNGQVFIGQGAGAAKTTGGNNTFVGTSAGGSATTGTGNTFVGVNDSTNGAGYAVTTGSKNTILGGYTGNQGGLDIRTANNYIVLSDGDGNPRGIFDASGNLLVGTTSSASAKLRVLGASSGGGTVYIDTNGAFAGTDTSTLGFSVYQDSGVRYNSQAEIKCIGDGNYSGSLAFFTQSAGTYPNSVLERARIDSSGNLLVGKDSDTFSLAGARISSGGVMTLTTPANELANFNRLTDDGILLYFSQDSSIEGSISVSGTTVSYNGGHLARWAQTVSAKDESLVKGTVLSNLDEMNVYVDADGNPVDNEQLNKVKVSDVEGDANVAGVFVNWEYDEAHNVDEINMAMTGDMIIRIAAGTTVVRGDLLMSAGDGTAKPQGDDIVRSKTIAKVTSTHVTCTYEDGSFCVPCVLMAC